MSNPFFRFKQFEIWHDKCAMKVGTDGVLLGAWTAVEGCKTILDIGTGTGLVALMLAQRSRAEITGIEIDARAASQAGENIARSPWSDRVEVLHADATRWFLEKQFDLIVSNPPFFNASLKSGSSRRDLARHTDSLPDNLLLATAARLLAENGRFTVILPYDKLEHYRHLAPLHGLHLNRQLEVVTQAGHSPKRVILVLETRQRERITETLTIELARHRYTPEYIALTREFYLDK